MPFRRLLCALLLFGVTGASRAQDWASLELPPNPTPQDTLRYLTQVREVLRKTPLATTSGKIKYATEQTLDRATAEKLKMALSRVPAAQLNLLLDQCAKAEEAGDKQASNENPTVRNYGGYVERLYRTGYTKMAVAAVAEMRDIPADQQGVLLQRLAEFPELVAVLATRPWNAAVEPHLSGKLMQRIETKSGWGTTKAAWLDYLIRLDSPRSWETLEWLMTKARSDTRQETYWAITKATATPKIDIAAAVKSSWDSLKNAPKDDGGYARIAALNGITEALIFMADEIRGGDPKYAARLFGCTLVDLLEQPFNDIGKAADFVRTNRKALVFDPAQKRYRVSGAAGGTSEKR